MPPLFPTTPADTHPAALWTLNGFLLLLVLWECWKAKGAK